MKRLPPEKESEYKEAWKTHTGRQLCEIYGLSMRGVTSVNKRLGLHKRLADESGKALKKYVRRKDAYPVGTIVTHKVERIGKALKFIINEKGERIRLHIHNWLSAGNTIPEGYVLCYKDPERDNPDELDNLVLKTRIQNLLEHRTKSTSKPLFRIDIKRKEKREKLAQRQKAKESVIQERQAKKAANEAAKQLKEKERAEKLAEKQRKEIHRKQISEASAYNKRFKRKEKVLQIKPVDTSKLIPVRVDKKTIVYAKSEADIPRIIERFSKKAS